jgi:hypothetical protein
MTRAVSVGRSQGLWAAGALGLDLMTISLMGCPGTLDPSQFPSNMGTAGVSGTAGTGTAGTGTAGTGTAGTGAACDMTKLITVTYTCTLAGACHDAAGSAASLSMMPADWPKLVGTTPHVATPPPAFLSICAADAAFKAMPYIMKGSATGDGLLLKKLQGAICSPGGVQMPSLNGPVKPADLTCFKQWATQLATQ